MRFKGITQSKRDPDVPVFNFSMGKIELILLRDVIEDARKRLPDSIFTMPMRARLVEGLRCLNGALREVNGPMHPKTKDATTLKELLLEDKDAYLQ